MRGGRNYVVGPKPRPTKKVKSTTYKVDVEQGQRQERGQKDFKSTAKQAENRKMTFLRGLALHGFE